jgi:hypothetical protein
VNTDGSQSAGKGGGDGVGDLGGGPKKLQNVVHEKPGGIKLPQKSHRSDSGESDPDDSDEESNQPTPSSSLKEQATKPSVPRSGQDNLADRPRTPHKPKPRKSLKKGEDPC